MKKLGKFAGYKTHSTLELLSCKVRILENKNYPGLHIVVKEAHEGDFITYVTNICGRRPLEEHKAKTTSQLHRVILHTTLSNAEVIVEAIKEQEAAEAQQRVARKQSQPKMTKKDMVSFLGAMGALRVQ